MTTTCDAACGSFLAFAARFETGSFSGDEGGDVAGIVGFWLASHPPGTVRGFAAGAFDHESVALRLRKLKGDAFREYGRLIARCRARVHRVTFEHSYPMRSLTRIAILRFDDLVVVFAMNSSSLMMTFRIIARSEDVPGPFTLRRLQRRIGDPILTARQMAGVPIDLGPGEVAAMTGLIRDAMTVGSSFDDPATEIVVLTGHDAFGAGHPLSLVGGETRPAQRAMYLQGEGGMVCPGADPLHPSDDALVRAIVERFDPKGYKVHGGALNRKSDVEIRSVGIRVAQDRLPSSALMRRIEADRREAQVADARARLARWLDAEGLPRALLRAVVVDPSAAREAGADVVEV